MPINVDTVYQTVQALANKEQRGYLTPQEFNLFAIQAQQDIFEQYIYDLNAVKLRAKQMGVEGMNRDLGDSVQVIMDKFRETEGVTVNSADTVTGGVELPEGRTGRIFAEDASGVRKTLRLIDPDEIQDLLASRWHAAAFNEFVYFEDGNRRIQVWTGTGQVTTGITCENIVGRPPLVYWGYTIVNEKPLWDPSTSQNFGLPLAEQADVVINILKLAGISIEDPELMSAAAREEQLNIQQENK